MLISLSDSGRDLKCFYSVSGETSASGLMVERISEQAGLVSLVEEVGQVLIEHGLYEQDSQVGEVDRQVGQGAVANTKQSSAQSGVR